MPRPRHRGRSGGHSHGLLAAAGVVGGGGLLLAAAHATGGSGGGVVSLKPLLRGVINRQGPASAAYRPAMRGYAVQGKAYAAVTWAELEPAGPQIVAGNAVDAAVAEVRQYNAAHPQQPPDGLLVRILTGIHSPQRVLSLAGAPVTLQDPVFAVGGPCPRFWLPGTPLRTEFWAFLQRFAAKYAAVPEIREVVVSPNGLLYSEPFLRYTGLRSNVQALLGAGYSASVDKANQLADVAHVARIFAPSGTRVAATVNPYETINADGTTGVDLAFTQQAVTAYRKLGNQVVLENDSIRQSFLTGTGAYQSLYSMLHAAGGPLGFQPSVPANVGDEAAVLGACAALGATHVEADPDYTAKLTTTQVATFTRELAANCQGC